jgi:hypothetical protein
MSFAFFPVGLSALDEGTSLLVGEATKLAPLAGIPALVVTPLSFDALNQ